MYGFALFTAHSRPQSIIQWGETCKRTHSAWSESCACLSPTPKILRGGQRCKFSTETPIFLFSEQSRMSTLSVQKFWAKKRRIILRNSEKHIWPNCPVVKLEKNRKLESGVVLLCWILLHISTALSFIHISQLFHSVQLHNSTGNWINKYSYCFPSPRNSHARNNSFLKHF